ncbi:MAG: hypothetical protein RLZ10_1500 [Bacteroidota bacterium]|jgi:hypothetical protein
MPNEKCILCGNETTVDVNTHVDFRTGYIEGAGQLCYECYQKGNSSSREMITIPKSLIKDNPNDFTLGSKVREHYYNNYEDKNETSNQWVCRYCGRDTSEIEYDYLQGTDHLECILKTNL